MKRLVLLLMLIPVFGFSQEKSLLVGFNGGPSLSTFSKAVANWPFVLKQNLGISIKYFLNQKLALETGISYEAKGSGEIIS